MKYESRPVTVEARWWDGSPEGANAVCSWLASLGISAAYMETSKQIAGPGRGLTTIGPHIEIVVTGRDRVFDVECGDYIVVGDVGTVSILKPSTFDASYKALEKTEVTTHFSSGLLESAKVVIVVEAGGPSRAVDLTSDVMDSIEEATGWTRQSTATVRVTDGG